MELREYVSIFRRRWLILAVVAAACLASMAVLTLLTTPRYTATTRLFFAVESTGSAAELAQGSTFAERQMTSYVQVARSPAVLGPVIEQLGLGTTPVVLAEQITATVPTDTVILDIAVTDPEAQRATDIANAVGASLSEVAAGMSPTRTDGSRAVRASSFAPAALPTTPSSPNLLRNLSLGAAIGLLLGAGAALLRNALDSKVRGEQDVRALTNTSVLGVIAFDEDVPRHPVILRDDPRSQAAEAVRRLRTNLQFIDVAERPRSVVVSSSVPGEGKTTTAINLAVSLADEESRVLLIDADLRRPSVDECLGLEGAAGLTTVLIGKATVADVVQPYGDSGLDVLTSGQIPPNPSELLGSKAMRLLLEQVTSTYDIVLIDSPPVLPVTDAAVLGRQVGGVLLVAGLDRIHRPQLRETVEALDTAGCHVVGAVVNKVGRREVGYQAYGRGYYAAEPESRDKTRPSGVADGPGPQPLPEPEAQETTQLTRA